MRVEGAAECFDRRVQRSRDSGETLGFKALLAALAMPSSGSIQCHAAPQVIKSNRRPASSQVSKAPTSTGTP